MSHMKVKILYVEHMDMWISIVEPLSAYWFQVIPAVQEGVRVWFESLDVFTHDRIVGIHALASLGVHKKHM